MGSLIDRISRVNILAIGLAIWSAATFASGFALSYVQLFLARTIVGVGEAVLQPATKSMITDIFLGRRLGMALSILALGSSVGGGAGCSRTVAWFRQRGSAPTAKYCGCSRTGSTRR